MKHLLFAGLMLLAACGASTGESAGVVQYEPAQTELTGTIETETDYGPPGFGRTPEEDERLTAVVLVLDAPVTIQAAAESDDETLTAVTRIQLMRDDANMNPALAGQRVRVTGQIFTPTTGQWVTDAALRVERIDPAE
ncbi:MAG: hypothetical protein AB7J28_03115 [Hyphomonadaceae bacterium]